MQKFRLGILLGLLLSLLGAGAAWMFWPRECAVTGLSEEIRRGSEHVPIAPGWRGQLNPFLSQYYGMGSNAIDDAECPSRDYLQLAGKLAMSGYVVSAQTVIGDAPAAAREGRLFKAMHALLANATVAPDDDWEFMAINKEVDRKIGLTLAKTGDERKFVTMVVRGYAYGDPIAVHVGVTRLRGIDAAPSMVAMATSGGKAVARLVEDIRNGKVKQ